MTAFQLPELGEPHVGESNDQICNAGERRLAGGRCA